MTEDNRSQQESTTQEQIEQDTLLELIESTVGIGRPLAAALRKKANGHTVDMGAAIADARKIFNGIADQVLPDTRKRVETFTPADLMDAYWQRIADKKDTVPTGFLALDRALSGGLEQDRLMVLLGAPGSGKTTFANQIADHVANSKRPVLYVTSEDLPMTLLAKTIARYGQIDYTAVQRGYPSEKAMINQAFTLHSNRDSAQLLRYLDATRGTTLDTIAEQAEAHFNAHKDKSSGAGVIVVDYLQRLARGENLGTDLRSSITVYTEQLRNIATDLHCTVIVLCAMNRASKYQTGDSTIASAKESGDIDYTADVIMAIGEPRETIEPAPGIRRWGLRIDKNRQGSVTYDGTHIELDWYPARQQFTAALQEDEETQSASEPYTRTRRGKR